MKEVGKSGIVIVFSLIVSATSAFGSASNIYITQPGTATGNCTSAVQTPNFFNNSVNWGSASNQIGPGTIVHLCGTITGTAGQAGLTFQGSGTSGSPVTLKFESGTQMSAPYWGDSSHGAINCVNRSYIVVDGGTDGIIQNTANGTSLANHQYSNGIWSASCTNSEFKNLTIQNIYLNQGSSPGATDIAGLNTADIALRGTSTNTSIHDNVLKNARSGVLVDFDSGGSASGVSVYNNTIADHGWHISMGADLATSTASGVQIYNNDISDWLNWQYPSATYHTDGIILFNNDNAAAVGTYSLYNNYFHGSLGAGSATGYIACGQKTSCTIFNNLMVDDGSASCAGYFWFYAWGGPHLVYNNTLVASPKSAYRIAVTTDGANAAGKTTVKNNIFINITTALHSYTTLANDIAASDSNVFRTTSGAAPAMATNDSTFITFAAWQSQGFDANSTKADPNLSAAYVPQSGSSAAGHAENLTRLGITPLTFDKAYVVRSLVWDAGAYRSGAPGTPVPPTNLSTLVR